MGVGWEWGGAGMGGAGGEREGQAQGPTLLLV